MDWLWANGSVGGWIDGWTDGRTDVVVGEWVGRWMDRRMDGRTDESTHEQIASCQHTRMSHPLQLFPSTPNIPSTTGDLYFLNLMYYGVNQFSIFTGERTKICFISYLLRLLKNLSDPRVKRMDISTFGLSLKIELYPQCRETIHGP